MQAVQENIQYVESTEESQADKGIDHPLVSCGDCGAIWRSHVCSLCPMCAVEVGDRFLLDEDQEWDLMEAVLSLEETTLSFTQEQLDLQMWRFRNLLCNQAPWYNMNSRRMIQACYQNLCTRGGTNPKAALAIAFFKEEFVFAPEEEKTVFPEVIQYQERDVQYDLQTPPW